MNSFYRYVSGFAGLNIIVSDEEQMVRYQKFSSCSGMKPYPQQAKLKHTAQGRAFFLVNGRRIHLDQCQKMAESNSKSSAALTVEQLKKMNYQPVWYERGKDWLWVCLGHSDFGDCIISESGLYIPLNTAVERGVYLCPKEE